MSKIEKQMQYNGFTITETCMKCGYLNPTSKDRYRCCTSSCPSKLSAPDRLHVLTNWNPADVEIETIEDVIDRVNRKNARSIAEHIDREILAKMMGKDYEF